MPNWCMFDAAVYGSKKELEYLVKRLNDAIDIGNKTKQWHLYCLFEQHGWTKDEILSPHFPYIGGSIEGVSPIEKSGDDYYIRVAMETRWSPMINGFNKLLGRYLNLHAVYVAEEPGCEIYINTDTEGRFFNVKYCLDDYDFGMEYFEDDDELSSYFKATYKKDIPLISELKDDCDIKIKRGQSVRFHRFVAY